MLHPISFSIPSSKVLESVPVKTKLVSSIVPGNKYTFDSEEAYYTEYKSAWFALTKKQVGWDCMCHYEIMANGCIPYFPKLEVCPKNTLALLPKNLMFEANRLYVQYNSKEISDLTDNDISILTDLAQRFLDYVKQNLTTEKMALYVLQKAGKADCSSILYLSKNILSDCLRCLTLAGFKNLFGSKCHDFPKIEHLYKTQNTHMYGKGFAYSNILDQSLHDSSVDATIEQIIRDKVYDVVICGSYHRGTEYWDLVNSVYSPKDIILFCGENEHSCDYIDYVNKGYTVFVRELANEPSTLFHEDWFSDSQAERLCSLAKGVRLLPGAVIEIGCWEGKSTFTLANAIYPTPLICNDTWLGNIEESRITGQTHITEKILKERDVYATFLNNMSTLTNGNFSVVKQDCYLWLETFIDDIKFCHIDAAGDYESVHKAISLLLPHVVNGGILCGNNFQSANKHRSDLNGGVERAVTELLPNFKSVDHLWYWKKTDFEHQQTVNIYWSGGQSEIIKNGAVETYIVECIKDRKCSLMINNSDGVCQSDMEAVGSTSPSEYTNLEKQLMTEPKIIGVLCTRGYLVYNSMLMLPLDDAAFERGVLDALKNYHSPSWQDRIPQAFWRGGASGGPYPSRRTATVAHLHNYPHADVKLTPWGGWERGKPIPNEHFGDRCGIEKHLCYKYILIIDGNVIASNLQWVFGSGSVPILITHPLNNWWFKKYLKPMVNYVPINYDLSDLKDKIEWLIKYDEAAQGIMMEAMKLANTILSANFQHTYIRDEIEKHLHA
jgi:hypothetical protein